MRRFVSRVAQKVSKLSEEQVVQLLESVVDDNDTFSAVFDSLTVGLVICDTNGFVILSNKAAERFVPFTLKPATLAEQSNSDVPVWNIIADEDIALYLKTSYENQQSNCSEEFTVETQGGTRRIIVVSVLPLVRNGRITGTIIQIDDVTEKRNQQTLLRRMENLASLTNLAASVAHEIKNPLGSISIHIQLIQRAFAKARAGDGLLPDKKFVEDYLDVVNEEIERLNKIIVDFLFAVRPITVNLEPVNPNEIIFRLLDFMKPEFEKNNIEIQTELLEKTPTIMLDCHLFKQVFMNLSQNAIAAMSDGGLFYIKSYVKDDKYILSIADNGCGMDEQTLSHVFEPYFTTKVTGTGLGLTMVYKIIKEFAGDIQVQSFVGEGTVFTISLPIPQKEKRLIEEKNYEV